MANGSTWAAQDTGPLLHLFRLVSLSLPVGSFSYSRGLEAAVHAGWVAEEASAEAWILGTLRSNFAALDGAMFCRMVDALQAGDVDQFLLADARLAAGRESRELQAEDRRLCEALVRLLVELGAPLALEAQTWVRTYPAAFAIAAGYWGIARFEALLGLLWAYVEGQAMAAVRLVPLGQTAAQRIMVAAVEPITSAAVYAMAVPDDEIGATGQALAIASAWHEDQYSRLFQS
jgi:urease accessory protein